MVLNFQRKCLRGIIFFVERYLKTLRYSEVEHLPKHKGYSTKGQLWKDFVFWTLKETLLKFGRVYENLSDKSETVTGQ